MARIKICKEAGCHNAQSTAGYCRLHYLKHWKEIKAEQQDKAAKRLNRYIESMCKKHPKRYVEAIKEDINSGRIFQEPTPRDDMDDLYHIFNEPSYEDDINRLIQDLIKSNK